MASPKGTIVLTGANGGLGSAVARHIVQSPDLSDYHALFLVRSTEKASTLNGILASAPSSFKYDVLSVDLSSLSSVRTAVNTINIRVAEGSLPPIRALLISAGYQELTTQTFTADGFDMTFQVNYLSQFLLVLSLLQSMDREHGRIVIVSGMNHDTEDPRNDAAGIYKDEKYKVLFHNTESLAKGTWSSPQEEPSSLSGQRRYGAAHLCEVMLMHELQNRLDKDPKLSNISVLGLDPGAMPTDICRRDNFFVRVMVMKVIMPVLNPVCSYFWPNGFLWTTTKSGADVLYAAFDTKTLGDSPKKVYLNGTDPWPISKEARDDGNRQALWRDSVEYLSMTKRDTALSDWE
ncbi:Short-chain dehydrogenase iccH [Paramyrothecium foliicola]|nr:Short-chain dehydrogenase iccH [Paramyrothecium foliicola]